MYDVDKSDLGSTPMATAAMYQLYSSSPNKETKSSVFATERGM